MPPRFNDPRSLELALVPSRRRKPSGLLSDEMIQALPPDFENPETQDALLRRPRRRDGSRPLPAELAEAALKGEPLSRTPASPLDLLGRFIQEAFRTAGQSRSQSDRSLRRILERDGFLFTADGGLAHDPARIRDNPEGPQESRPRELRPGRKAQVAQNEQSGGEAGQVQPRRPDREEPTPPIPPRRPDREEPTPPPPPRRPDREDAPAQAGEQPAPQSEEAAAEEQPTPPVLPRPRPRFRSSRQERIARENAQPIFRQDRESPNALTRGDIDPERDEFGILPRSNSLAVLNMPNPTVEELPEGATDQQRDARARELRAEIERFKAIAEEAADLPVPAYKSGFTTGPNAPTWLRNWTEWGDVNDRAGVGPVVKSAFQQIFAAEGGLVADGNTVAGIRQMTLDELTRGRIIQPFFLPEGATPATLTPEQRLAVYEAFFENRMEYLGNVEGGLQAVEDLGDPEAAAALLDTFFRHGSGDGSAIIYGAIEAVGGVTIARSAETRGEMMQEFGRLIRDDGTRRQLLDQIRDRRNEMLRERYKPNPVPEGDRRRADHFAFQ